jgi:hypothetical protein
MKSLRHGKDRRKESRVFGVYVKARFRKKTGLVKRKKATYRGHV